VVVVGRASVLASEGLDRVAEHDLEGTWVQAFPWTLALELVGEHSHSEAALVDIEHRQSCCTRRILHRRPDIFFVTWLVSIV
jgi:hypothetical protein